MNINPSVEHFIPCRDCAKKPGPFPGYSYATLAGKRYIVECDCHKTWLERYDLLRRCAEAGVWPDIEYDPLKDYKGTDSAEAMKDIVRLAANWKELNPQQMFYVYGPNGTQKTTLMMWLARELIKSGLSVKYTLMETLLVSLTPDFNDKLGSREAFVDKALSVDVLFIDESFDRSKVTLYKSGYQIPFLDRFIRERFDIGRKPIIFISNKPTQLVANEGFGESLGSLIARSTLNTTITLKDVYTKVVTQQNTKGLFA